MPTFRASQETESETRYSALIARLESEVEDAPARYKLKVFLLSTLGYGYPIAILASLLGMIGGTVYLSAFAPATVIIIGLKVGAKFIAVPVLILTYTVFRSLWVRVPAPEGRQIKRAEAPLLFALCGQIQKQLRGPKIHNIIITESFNAGVVQIPRLGMFGWQKNYLIIGMPLALALSPEQFEAVVAHEYGHLAGAHGHFSSWVYRTRQTWIRLTEVLEEKAKWGSFLFTRFFKWFSPYFNAYTFVLARTEEYEADRCAVEIVGAGITADALIAVSVWDRALGNRFWPELWQQADLQCQPPYLPYGHMVDFFKQPLDAEFKRESLENILAETTSNEDTHPCFSDRVRALGRDPRLPPSHENSAAEHLFDQFLAEFLAEFDQTWREDSAPHWREQFQQFMDWRRKLAGLQARAKYRTLNEDDLWLLAALTEKIDGDVTALPIYRSLFQAHPEHAGAAFSIGRILLDEEDPKGLEFLETAMDQDSDYVIDACALAYGHLMSRGRETEAGSFEKRAWRHNELENLAQEERDQISADDALIHHTLDPEALEPLTVQLRGVPEIKCAYLMCKKVEYKIQSPVYILVLERPDSWTSIETDRQLIENMAAYLDFPDDIFVVTSNFLSSRNRSEFMGDRSAVIYERAESITGPTWNGPWQMYVTAGTDAFHEGNNAQAEKQFEIALEKAEIFGTKDLRLAETLTNLATLYHHRNACAEAVPLSKRALELRENIFDSTHIELTDNLAELARLYRDLED